MLVERQVGQYVRIIREKHRLAVEMTLDRLQSLADVRIQTGIDERDIPSGDVTSVQLDSLAAVRQLEVVRHAFVIPEEKLFDQVAAVTEAENELRMAEVRVVAHQIPEDRPRTDIRQWLRDRVGVLAQ